jgi:hypothetical protein
MGGVPPMTKASLLHRPEHGAWGLGVSGDRGAGSACAHGQLRLAGSGSVADGSGNDTVQKLFSPPDRLMEGRQGTQRE